MSMIARAGSSLGGDFLIDANVVHPLAFQTMTTMLIMVCIVYRMESISDSYIKVF